MRNTEKAVGARAGNHVERTGASHIHGGKEERAMNDGVFEVNALAGIFVRLSWTADWRDDGGEWIDC